MLGVPDDSAYVTDEWLEENVLLDKGKPGYKSRSTEVNPFRNFIAKQVIQNRRFIYLVRYTTPETVRALMSNRVIVHYVLSRIADIKDAHITESQIDRYYQNLPRYDEKRPNVPLNEKIDALADYLVGYSFERNVFLQKKGIVLHTHSATKNVETEHLKALTGLYLTVAFIAIKNLVKTNARYYIAFAAFERDMTMFKQKTGLSKDDWTVPGKTPGTSYTDYFALTQHFLERDAEKKYPKSAGIPCKDLIKIAYISLAYNLPRYKKLTTDALFDKDSDEGKKREEKRGTIKKQQTE